MMTSVRLHFLCPLVVMALYMSSCGRQNKIESGSSSASVVSGKVADVKGVQPKSDDYSSPSLPAVAPTLPNGHPLLVDTASTSAQVSASVTAFEVSAPVSLLFGPDGLRALYEPVFGNQPRAGSIVPWFSQSAPGVLAANPRFAFFSPEEFVQLGGSLLELPWNPLEGIRLQLLDVALRHSQRLDPDYIRALRTFLGDACRNLIERESADAENLTSSLLYEGEAPTLKRLDAFFARLSPQTSQDPGKSLMKPFHEALLTEIDSLPKGGESRTVALRLAYRHLCVAVASDIRVIAR